jgi:hypothetical protein
VISIGSVLFLKVFLSVSEVDRIPLEPIPPIPTYTLADLNRKGPGMTFPEDHLREVERVEDHSALSIFVVNLAMIGAALAGLSFVIP